MKRLVVGIVLLGVAVPASTESLDAVVARIMPTIISIRAESAWGGVVFGTGFIIEATGIVATNVPLFDDADVTTLTGTWHSLTSNTLKELRQDGELLTGFYANDADSVTYHLTLREDGHYRGHVKAVLTVNLHSDSWRSWEAKVCEFETKITLRAVTPNRIECRIHDYEVPERDEGRAQQDTCLGSEPLKWIDFVWIRAE